MRAAFPSYLRPEKYECVIDTDTYNNNAPIHPHFTFNAVGELRGQALQIENFGEFLSSLAHELLRNDELAAALRYHFNGWSDAKEDIEFAARIKYKPGKKKQYYSRHFRKVSRAVSKQYDRRWEEVPESFDGSPQAIYDFVVSGRTFGFDRFRIAESIRKEIMSNRKLKRTSAMPTTAAFLDWNHDYYEGCAIKNAWDACIEASNAYVSKERTKSFLSQYEQHTQVTMFQQ